MSKPLRKRNAKLRRKPKSLAKLPEREAKVEVEHGLQKIQKSIQSAVAKGSPDKRIGEWFAEAGPIAAFWDEVCVAACRRDGKIIGANDNFANLVGLLPAELVKQKVWDICHPSESDVVTDCLRRAFDGEIGVVRCKQFQKPDGTVTDAYCLNVLMKDGSNKPPCVVAIVVIA